MSPNDEPSIATRASLLHRLKDLDDEASWQRFFDTYWRLIHRVALKAGLTDAEAQDVVQETVISVARHLPGFRYDSKVCSFKTWMLRLTRWRIIDQLRKRLPSEQRISISGDDDATASAALDRLSGKTVFDLEAVWNEEWQTAVLAYLCDQLNKGRMNRSKQRKQSCFLSNTKSQTASAILSWETPLFCRVGRSGRIKGQRPVTNSLPPLIEPNGRFSHIRLSELIHRAAIQRAVVGSS